MKTSVWLLTCLVSLSLAVPHSIKPRQSTFTDYLFVYFTGQATDLEERIYLSVSNNNNPASWTQVNGGNPVLTSSVGSTGVRDPSIIRSHDGSKFWVIASDVKVYDSGIYDTETGSKGIVVWESYNLRDWSPASLRIISPSNAGMTWAPDAIWDPSTNQYLVFWTSNLIGDGWYIMKAYTSDFVTFSTATKFLSGAGMDTTIVLDKSSNKFYRFAKNGPNDAIEEASATSLSGTWNVVSNGLGYPTLAEGEGPLIFQDNITPSVYHLFIDDFVYSSGYVPFETTNIASGSWKPSVGYTLPPKNRHGYVIGITAADRSCVTGGAC